MDNLIRKKSRAALVCIGGFAVLAGAGIVTTHEEAASFFGGKAAKVVYLDAGSYSTIKYVDFSESSLQARTVCSNSSSGGSNIQISPDGSRVAYDNGGKCLIAKIESNTGEIHEVGDGANPQWWFHPTNGKQYIMMQRGTVPGDGNGIYAQEVDADGKPVGSPVRMLEEPMANGGRSADGKFMANVDEEHDACTHGHGMYVLEDPLAIENNSIAYWIFATAEGWYSGGTAAYRGYCNGSMCPAGPGHNLYGSMLHMGSGHIEIYIRKPDPAHYTTTAPVQLGTGGADGGPSCTSEDKAIPEFAAPLITLKDPQFMGLDMSDHHWGFSDWSTHPDYIAATGGRSSTSGGNKNGYFVNLSQAFGTPGFALKFAEDDVAQPDLWVQASTSSVSRNRPQYRQRSLKAIDRYNIVDMRGRTAPAANRGTGVYLDPANKRVFFNWRRDER